MLPGQHSGSVNDLIPISQFSSTQSRLLAERKEILPGSTQRIRYCSAAEGNLHELTAILTLHVKYEFG